LAAIVCVCAAAGSFGADPAGAAAERSAGDAPQSAPISSTIVTAKPKSLAAIARQRDGTLLIAGRALRCGSNRNVLDRHLPNLGLAAPGVLVFNPRELSEWSDTVRLFVYHHECGHHNVGGSELGADCWATKQGVRDGWLTQEGLNQVCRSFGDGPATSTHPAGARRCANLNRCFSTAVAALAKEKANATAKAPGAQPAQEASEPKLIQEPLLKRSGMRPSLDSK
jgi:hypothetical protein